MLTGEDASYRGVVKPSEPFSPGKGGWGAWELVGRYGELEIDDDAFPLFADPLDREPAVHVFYDTHVPWLQVGDDLPKKGAPQP